MMLTFKNIEDSLETFSDDSNQNIHHWFINFEETVELCSWTDVQKVIYYKRLQGSAKLFLDFECMKNWTKLKKILKEEFASTVNSMHVQKELSRTKKKNNESYLEYTYCMLDR